MGQTHGVETPFYDKNDQSNKPDNVTDNRELRHSDETMNSNEIFTPEELQDLAKDDSFEGWERLIALANKYDIPIDDRTSPKEIIDKLIVAMSSQDAPNMFNGFE